MTTGASSAPRDRRCRGCGSRELHRRLDLGEQPLCNRFLTATDAAEYRHPLSLVACESCGLVQICEPPPAAQLQPRFDWITYREPEGHLDRMVEELLRLPGIGPQSVIGAVSYKDDTTLERLRRRGCRTSWRLDAREDLGLGRDHAEIESVQDRIAPAALHAAAARHPRADLLLARHILEHVHDLQAFFDGLAQLVKPGGLLVFESPDCERALRARDFTVIWEEHVLLFTPTTFADFWRPRGLNRIWSARYPYPLEDSLVAAVQAVPAGAAAPAATGVSAGAELFASFAADLPKVREPVRAHLAAVRARGGRVALLGAGHAACTFLNLLQLRDLMDFVVDDDPRKSGLFMPGSRLPIRPGTALLEERVDLCLLAVSAEAEERVVESHRTFSERGGSFASISPLSRRALLPAPRTPER